MGIQKDCKHNTRKSRCRDCSGSAYCSHERYRESCRDCNGSSRCSHNHLKQYCRECKLLGCGGSSICLHDKVRSVCKDCGGGSICIHSRVRSVCADCGGSSICKHNKRRLSCKVCIGFPRLAQTMLWTAKKRAAKKGLPFNLSKEDVLKLIGDGICPVFGTQYYMASGLSGTSASLDRQKPELGYVKGNCSVISYRANTIKQDATADEVQRVADWIRQKETIK